MLSFPLCDMALNITPKVDVMRSAIGQFKRFVGENVQKKEFMRLFLSFFFWANFTKFGTDAVFLGTSVDIKQKFIVY